MLEHLQNRFMSEGFLQFLWKHKLYNNEQLRTQSGKLVQVISPGFQNADAGPDFTNSRLQIGDVVWVGNVEIHSRSSNWFNHRHHEDLAYDSVILHVVEEDDIPVKTTNGVPIETLCISYSEILSNNFKTLLAEEKIVPCEAKIKQLPSIKINSWLDSLLAERLEEKTKHIYNELEQNTHNWNEVFYRFLAKSFGFKTNALPFELLAKALPLKLLAKHREDIFQLEALLFGTAGLLYHKNVKEDSYLMEMRKEYQHLQRKYSLQPIRTELWKFAKMRPLSFPSIRLAQFAQLVHRSYALFSAIIEIEKLDDLIKLLQAETSIYWKKHYFFGKESAERTKSLGKSSINSLIINTVIPFLFVYGRQKDNATLSQRATFFLEELPAESNSIVDTWANAGIKAKSASDSQALIQLRNSYCINKSCLRCSIGHAVLTSTEG